MAFLTAIRAQQRAGQSLGGMVKNLVIDGGFNHGLTITSTQWEVFVGLRTYCRIVFGHSSRWSFPLGCPLFVTTSLLGLLCPSAYLLGQSSYSRLLKNYSRST